MARNQLFEEFPEIGAAISETLNVALAQKPAGILHAAASQLTSAAQKRRMDASEGSPRAEMDEEASAKMRAKQQMRGRRAVVFSAPVQFDASENWTPTVIEKSESERSEIDAVIKATLLFAGMDDDVRRMLIDAMERKIFVRDEAIVRQGDPGDFYYLVHEGTADVHVGDRVVLSLRNGQGFGELALLYDSPRAATVIATSMSLVCWAIDRDTFKHLTIGSVSRKRRQYESFLGHVPILSTLTPEEVGTVADALQPLAFAAGESVVNQGDTGADRFYIVESGELAATMEGIEGEVCSRLTAGSYFGERALITDAPRAATIRAMAPSRCLAMDRSAFLRLLGPLTDLLKRNMVVYAKYMTQG